MIARLLLSFLIALTSFTLASAPAAARPPSAVTDDEIRLAQLPPEARETLAAIRSGGPFAYPKDGTVFGNREGLLPRRPA